MMNNTRISTCLIALLSGLFCSISLAQQPNIVVIMADDLGYSDLSCYGSEMSTPNIDKLADGGLRFSRFYASPMCVTTRVAFLSGIEYRAAGNSNFPKGYSLAYLLRNAGYATSWVGKNHGLEKLRIGNANTDYGFDHFYGFAGGQINSFTGAGNVKWQDDGTIFSNQELPQDFYATDAFTDHAITYMEEAIEKEQPFFSFVAYNAPHTPLNAPERNVKKYYDPANGINAFKEGWDGLREKRMKRLKEIGLVDESVTLSPLGVEVPRWDALPQSSSNAWDLQQNFECLARAAYAGMVDNMDENIGRIITFLEDPNKDGNKADSQLDNTLIIFVSDNGGCYAGVYNGRNSLPWSRTSNFTNNYGWGALSNTPFRYYKHASHEGALRTPLVVHWPKGIKQTPNSIQHEMVRIWDLYPTILEVAGTNYDTPRSGLKPIMGQSLLPLLKKETFEEENYFVSAYNRTRGVVKDNYKLCSYWDSPYELYDLLADPTETNNLADEKPVIYKELIEEWTNYTRVHGFVNDAAWNMPVGTQTRGWGYDFLHSAIVQSVPECMADNVNVNTKLSLTFSGVVSFSGTSGKRIRLQKYGDPRIIWSADPEANSPNQGKRTITFEDFPSLEPGAHYYITWDAGFAKYKNATGTLVAIPPVRESAYAFRFRTANPNALPAVSPLMTAKVYPNPSNHTVTIDLPSPSAIMVYDMNGKTCATSVVPNVRHRIDVSQWQPGTYFVSAQLNEFTQVCKMIIQ